MAEAARLGLGVALLAMSDVLPELESGTLVRLVPRWYADAGAISVYFASRTLMPGKTRVFVDWVAEAFKREQLAERFAGGPHTHDDECADPGDPGSSELAPARSTRLTSPALA